MPASDRQVSQLLLQVDANVAVAQRSLQDLARVVNQSSGQMNNALGTTVQAHARLNNAFNQSRLAQMELSHVVTASVDAYAAGFSPIRILTLEMGRLAEAATFLGGGGTGVLAKLGSFMSGPWGIAMLLGVSVLSQLIGKMGESATSIESLVQKMREHAKQAEQSRIADQEWANTIDGLIDRNMKLIDTLKQRLKAQEDVSLEELQGAQRDQATAQKAVADAQKRVDNLKAQQRAEAANPPLSSIVAGAVVHGSDPAAAALARQLAQAEQDLATAKQGLATAKAAITQGTIAVGEEEGKAAADLSAAVDLWSKRYISALHGIEQAKQGALAGSSGVLTDSFETLKKAMSDAAGQGLTSQFYNARNAAKNLGNELAQTGDVAKYAAGIRALAASLEAAAEAAKNAKKGAGEFGKQIGFDEAASIAKGAGLTVTSGFRSEAKQAELYRTVRTANNPVARPGTSAHEGVNGKWALDIAFAPGLTAQSLRKLYGDQGVQLSAVYKESGHFHIEGSRSQAAAAERAADRATVSGDRQQSAFDQAQDNLDRELLQAQASVVSDYNQRADLAEQQVTADTKKLQDSIAGQLQLGKDTDYQQGITEKQAEILSAKAQELDAAKKNAIEMQRQLQSLDSKQANQDQQYGFELDGLKFAEEMAKSTDAKRRLQLEILDIQYQEKEADLQILLAKQKLAGLADDAARTQAEINNLPIDKARDVSRVEQGTMDPLQRYFSDLPHDADQVKNALQSIEVDGIQGLAGALAQAGKGWGAMRDAAISALQDIASKLIELGIERMIFSLFGNAVLGGLGGGLGAGALNFSGFTSSAGSLLSTDFSGAGAGITFGLAGGGFVSGPGSPTSDSIPAMLSNGEYVMNAGAVSKFGVGFLDAMNEGKIPHRKGGGLLGALGFLSPTAFLATRSHFNPLALLSPLGYLATGGGKGLNPLAMLSPGAFLASKLFSDSHDGPAAASLPGMPRIAVPKAANSNMRGGDTYNIHVLAPNTGDPVADRRTSLQQAADIRRAVAGASAKGLA